MKELRKYTDFESLKADNEIVQEEKKQEAIQKHKAFEEAIIFFRMKKTNTLTVRENEK